MKDQIQWAAPSPLWAEAASSANAAVRRAFRQPALLRFASDTFMDDFAALLESQPARLGEYLALPETWRAPAATPSPTAQAPEFVRKLSNLQLAAGRKLNQLSGLTPAKVISPRSPGSITIPANAISVAIAAAAQSPLKFYQPAHQRFYLVTACLVCGVGGLPDHALRSQRDERVGYVVRRIFQSSAAPRQPADSDEYAFVATAQGNGWQKVSNAAGLVKGEEQLPLFAINFIEDDGRRRRLFGGMIPVGKREAYMGAGTFTPTTNGSSAPNATPKTARKIHFRMQVTEPWKALLRTADDDNETLGSAAALTDPVTRLNEMNALRKESRQSVQTLSWYILLDFVKYLQLYLPRLWPAVLAQSKAGRGLNQPETNLYDALDGMQFVAPNLNTVRAGTNYAPGQFASSMLNALSRMGRAKPTDPAKLFWEEKLEAVTTPYNRAANPIDPNWPDFLYPLADLEATVPLPPASIAAASGEDADDGDGLPSEGVPSGLAAKQSRLDKLAVLVVRALPRDSNAPAPPPPLASQPVLDTREGTFVIRCVYERPVCGPLDPPLLSEPSARFQMASFFDPDAPARPIRIALPLDTSAAGFRKFDKNTAFMISDQLCGQMSRLKGITFADLVLSVLPWPFHKSLSVGSPEIGPCKKGPGLELGMICTLSIPIITICALILLFVIVLLLDIIFKWIPFFIMCFPLPGFKGKKS